MIVSVANLRGDGKRHKADRTGFDTVRYRGMTADFSWGRSAAAYRHIYENL